MFCAGRALGDMTLLEASTAGASSLQTPPNSKMLSAVVGDDACRVPFPGY
jgi:hypothetical protein